MKTTTSEWIRPLAAALVVLTLLGAAPALQAQGARMNGFQRTGDYLLEVDGASSGEAKVYRSASAQAMLVVAPELAAPVLILPRQRSVQKVSLLKLDEKPDGSIDLLPNPVYAAEPPFQVVGSDVLFSVEGRNARLLPKPALIGFQQPAELTAHSPEYGQRAGYYEPSASVVEALRAQGKSVRVQIFFGTWCPACGQMVPRIMKVAEQTGGSKIDFQFYGLARQFSGDAEAKKYGIKSVPTGVIFVDGKEVGRLSGNDWASPETALRDLIGS
jgi:thiol-disulfide isomerase/thioredoxin